MKINFVESDVVIVSFFTSLVLSVCIYRNFLLGMMHSSIVILVSFVVVGYKYVKINPTLASGSQSSHCFGGVLSTYQIFICIYCRCFLLSMCDDVCCC